MDPLEDLPTTEEDTETPEQTAVINKYFPHTPKKTWRDTSKWKIIAFSSIAFLILSNPFIHNFLLQITGGTMTALILEVLLFVIVMIAVVIFM